MVRFEDNQIERLKTARVLCRKEGIVGINCLLQRLLREVQGEDSGEWCSHGDLASGNRRPITMAQVDQTM